MSGAVPRSALEASPAAMLAEETAKLDAAEAISEAMQLAKVPPAVAASRCGVTTRAWHLYMSGAGDMSIAFAARALHNLGYRLRLRVEPILPSDKEE